VACLGDCFQRAFLSLLGREINPPGKAGKIWSEKLEIIAGS
jgi:hypothetical protein